MQKIENTLLGILTDLKIRVDADDLTGDEQLHGICNAVLTPIGDRLIRHRAYSQLMDAFYQWPETSGDAGFPVEGYKHYYQYENQSKWHPDNPYSNKRKRLLVWLIEYFQEKVNAEHHTTDG